MIIPGKIDLGFFPTPVVELDKLSALLGGPSIYMKRDDLTGLALGGNKTRKLAFILHDALEQGCDTVITAGASQSNHCRQTAAAAAQHNLECHLVLGGEPPSIANGNLLLDTLFGAHIHWAGENRKGEDIPALFDALKHKGKTPAIIPYGGSNSFGALGFIDALNELEMQLDTDSLSHIVFASSSGGTHAGMMLGKALLKKHYTLTGINIDKGDKGVACFERSIITLANRTAQQFNMGVSFTHAQLTLCNDYLGEGYGVIGQAEKEAIALTAQLEGILLDPVYTGRAMAGLIGMIRKGQLTQKDKVLFWHTGGAPALFAYADAFTSTA